MLRTIYLPLSRRKHGLLQGKEVFQTVHANETYQAWLQSVGVRTDATTGFIMQFDEYTGEESTGSGLGTRVVKKFTEELANTGCA